MNGLVTQSLGERKAQRVILCFKEIVEFWLCIQILLEPEDPFVLDNITNLTVGIEEVSKFPCPRGARLHTGGVPSVPHPLDTEGALLHGTLHAPSISGVGA